MTQIGKKTTSRAPRAIIMLAAAFVVMLWSGLFYDSMRTEEVAIHQARKDVSNLALAYREHISRTVSAIDELLIAIVAEHTRYPDEYRIPEWVEGLPIFREMVVQLALAGPDGIARFSNLGLSGPVVGSTCRTDSTSVTTLIRQAPNLLSAFPYLAGSPESGRSSSLGD
jgi:hypothetical protein